MTRRILVTGSRDWSDEATVNSALAQAFHEYGPDVVLVHGACPTGADAIAQRIWLARGLKDDPHPADWDRYGKKAGPRRNREMVDLGADICIAFPLPESRGTRDCMKAAEEAGIPVRDVTAR